MMECSDLMQRHPLLGGISEEVFRKLAGSATRVDLDEGDRVWLPGSRNDCVFLVIDGLIRLDLELPEGRRQLLELVEAGQIFGDLELFRSEAAAGAASAAWRSLLVRIPHAAFLCAYESEPRIAYRLNQTYAQRRQDLQRTLARQSCQQVEGRLASLLLRLKRANGRHESRLPVKLTQEELADMLGTTRQSVSVPFRRWKQDGVLTVNKGYINIRQPEVLRAASESNLR